MIDWKEMTKKVAYWTVPRGFLDTARTLRKFVREKYATSSEEKAILKRNHKLRACHQGKRCFILATGPSIKEQNLKLLQGEICIAVSNFFVHPDFAIIKPRYYCVAPYHLPITEDAWDCWMAEMSKGTGDAAMFFGLADRLRNQRNGVFSGRQVHYIDFGGSLDTMLAREIDLTGKIPGPQSVTIMALIIAVYMGFQQIYLLGFDHSWILHLNKSSHFYSENRHALNRQGYNEWFGSDLESQCQDYIRLWKQYKMIKYIASFHSIKIQDATANGLLDVFPKISYEKIFI